jgi:L-threonylcarbamoyladenylate synthase
VSRESLSAALGEPVLQAIWKGGAAPPSPGMKYRHYAPRAPLILVTGSRSRRGHLLEALTEYYQKQGVKVCLLNSTLSPVRNLHGDEGSLARDLYRDLRRCDNRGAGVILAEGINPKGLGAAVMNRLGKAAIRVVRV